MTKITVDKALIEQVIKTLLLHKEAHPVAYRLSVDALRAALTEPEPAQQEPADCHHFPKSNTGVAADAINAVLSERNYPASPAAAARCGWEAAHRLLKSMLAESAAPDALHLADEVLLTDREIIEAWNTLRVGTVNTKNDFARAIEKAVHQKVGIK